MKKNLIPALMLGAIIFASCEQTKTENKGQSNLAAVNAPAGTSEAKITAEDFTKKAYKGNMMEIQLGQIAQKKASKKEVKQFAEMVVKDHKAANEKLKNIAKQKNIKLADSLGAEMKEHKTMLEKKSGAAFDKAYMDMMVKDHTKSIKLYESAINDLNNEQALSQYATQALETIEMHQKRAKEINQKLDTNAKASAK